MKYKRYRANLSGRVFLIEEDNPDVGFYLYVYEGNKCVKDYLQCTLENAKEIALEDFLVPMSIWEEIL